MAAVAEQGHVIVGKPLREGQTLLDLSTGQRRRCGSQLGDRLAQLLDHRLPVFHGGPHVAQHTHDAGRQIGTLLVVDHAVDLDVHPRFAPHWRRRAHVAGGQNRLQMALAVTPHREDRVNDQVQGEALAVDLHRRGVDQEGHVVVDDIDHRMARRPAVLGHRRAQHPHQGLSGVASRAKLPVRKQGAQQILWGSRQQVFGVKPAEVFAAKDFDQGPLGRLKRALQRGPAPRRLVPAQAIRG